MFANWTIAAISTNSTNKKGGIESPPFFSHRQNLRNSIVVDSESVFPRPAETRVVRIVLKVQQRRRAQK